MPVLGGLNYQGGSIWVSSCEPGDRCVSLHLTQYAAGARGFHLIEEPVGSILVARRQQFQCPDGFDSPQVIRDLVGGEVVQEFVKWIRRYAA